VCVWPCPGRRQAASPRSEPVPPGGGHGAAAVGLRASCACAWHLARVTPQDARASQQQQQPHAHTAWRRPESACWAITSSQGHHARKHPPCPVPCPARTHAPHHLCCVGTAPRGNQRVAASRPPAASSPPMRPCPRARAPSLTGRPVVCGCVARAFRQQDAAVAMQHVCACAMQAWKQGG
jgi:hypothetical protein